MDENILKTTEESLPEAPKKKSCRTLVTIISAITAFVVVAAVLLSTVLSPFGHYISARWNMLFKNYEAAYSHLDKMNKPVLDSEELMLGFIVKPAKTTFTGTDGNPYFSEEFEYDENGNLLKHKESYSYESFKETYDYDDKGNLIKETHYVKGEVESYSILRDYDEQNNVTSYKVETPDGRIVLEITLDYTYEGKYPASADMVIVNGREDEEYKAELTFLHDKKGYLTEITYKGERTVISYEKTIGECETVFSFQYDKDYFVSELTITETFSYVSEYSNEKHTQKYERCEEFNKTDPVRLDWKRTVGSNVSTGWKEWQYDECGNLLLEKSYDVSEGTEFTSYTYDKNGFLISKNDNDDHIEEYTNDEHGNPTTVKHTRGENKEVYHTENEYEYDKYGNILKKTAKTEECSFIVESNLVVEYEDWQVIYKPIDKRNVFELYELYDYINYLDY